MSVEAVRKVLEKIKPEDRMQILHKTLAVERKDMIVWRAARRIAVEAMGSCNPPESVVGKIASALNREIQSGGLRITRADGEPVELDAELEKDWARLIGRNTHHHKPVERWYKNRWVDAEATPEEEKALRRLLKNELCDHIQREPSSALWCETAVSLMREAANAIEQPTPPSIQKIKEGQMPR